MTHHLTKFAVATSLALLLTASTAVAQDAQSTHAETTPAQPSLDLPPQRQGAIDEINELRQRLGGGVTAQLSELFDDPIDEPENHAEANRTHGPAPVTAQQYQNDFLEELQRLINLAESQTDPQLGPPTDRNMKPKTDPWEESNARAAISDDITSYREIRLNSQNTSQNPPNSARLKRPDNLSLEFVQRQTHLRSAARRLERTAAELEETDLTNVADQLRQTAQRLWHEARQRPLQRR